MAKKNEYFTQETEDAIIEYNRLSQLKDGHILRSAVYSKHIHYPFFKLTQNIIHTFKFYHTEVEDLTHLQHEIIIFLLDKISMFHPVKSADDRIRKIISKEFGLPYETSFQNYIESDRVKCTTKEIQAYVDSISEGLPSECIDKLKTLTPAKAFSYFGTIVKRWLIHYTRNNYSKKINTTDILEVNDDLLPQYTHSLLPPDSTDLGLYIDEYMCYMDENIRKIFPKDMEYLVAGAVLEIFRQREEISVFNKKALYIYIREQIEVPTPQITKVVKRLKRVFDTQYVFYLEHGYTNFTF